jgi:hypothetical protein
MKCEKCDYQKCGDDECEECNELLVTGLCIGCNVLGNCGTCGKEIDLKKYNHITTVMYQYFCDMNCYEKRN